MYFFFFLVFAFWLLCGLSCSYFSLLAHWGSSLVLRVLSVVAVYSGGKNMNSLFWWINYVAAFSPHVELLSSTLYCPPPQTSLEALTLGGWEGQTLCLGSVLTLSSRVFADVCVLLHLSGFADFSVFILGPFQASGGERYTSVLPGSTQLL